MIDNITGVLAVDTVNVIREIISADIIAIAVGSKALSRIIPLIAQGTIERFKEFPHYPLDIIIAENLRNAAQYMCDEFKKIIGLEIPVDSYVGFIETSIGKMVPIMTQKDVEDDILQVFAESYNTLILDRKGFKNPVPDIMDLEPKENIKAWVDRKSFIHNLGHATAAYLGYIYNTEFIYIYEALAVKQINSFVRETMLEAAEILHSMYLDEFTINDLTVHIDDLVERFENRFLKDTIFRVGMDLFRKLGPEDRKLGPEDRMSGAIKAGIKYHKPFNKILYALVCGCFFRARDENGVIFEQDVKFIEHYSNGIGYVLSNICGFNKIMHFALFRKAEEYFLDISENHVLQGFL